ncbi:MAG: hypothetical protein JHD02_06685 [Thermoleophilaceae bacterium]|nr:hypothetical protein [Thermoleophilaceae bacterium]
MQTSTANQPTSEPESTGRTSACGRPIRPLMPGGQRPADLLASFFLAAIAMLLAGIVVATLTAADVTGWWGNWLALHLLLVGGVSQLILGAAQFFSTAYLATDPPSKSMVRAELVVWNAGTVLLAVGVPVDSPPLTDLGALLIACGLALFAVALKRLERRSLQTARWAIRWYYASASALAVGALIGVAMTRGVSWPYGSLLGAHLALNIAGWLGAAIIGTLHTFYPSLTHTQLKHPRLQGPTFISWIGGVTVLAAGEAFDLLPLAAVGWSALTAGAVLMTINIVGSTRAAQAPVSLAARLVGGAQLFLPVGLALALVMVATEGVGGGLSGPWRAALGVLLAGGWIGLTVAGSMLHLLTVLNRVRNLMRSMPAPAPRRDAALTAALIASLIALAVSKIPEFAGLSDAATLAVLISSAPVVGRILYLAGHSLARRVEPSR